MYGMYKNICKHIIVIIMSMHHWIIISNFSDGSSISDEEVEKVVKEILMNHDPSEEGFVTQEEFLIWTLNDSLNSIFMDIIFQVIYTI